MVIVSERNLNIGQKLYMGYKDVGIKDYKNLIVFSLMDKDEIWVLRRNKDKFEKYKVFKDVGQVPFDAMIDGLNYIVGFLKILLMKKSNYRINLKNLY